MDLKEAMELKVGDRVVFEPVPKQDYYVFQSSMIPNQREILFPKKDYFVSIIEYVDANNQSFAKNPLFTNKLNSELKNKTTNVWIRLDNVADPILFDHLKIPSTNSDLSLEEAIEEAEQFGADFSKEALLPQEVLSVLNLTNNLGDLSIKKYQDYLHYSLNFYREMDLKTFENHGILIPENSTLGKELNKFNELVALRRERTKLDLEFIEFMDYVGADTYKEMMLLLQDGQVEEQKLLQMYKSKVLKKQEWLVAACRGSNALYDMVEMDERK